MSAQRSLDLAPEFAARVLHDVRIGEDIAPRVHHSAGADHALLCEEGGLFIVSGDRRKSGGKDFDNRGLDRMREILQIIT